MSSLSVTLYGHMGGTTGEVFTTTPFEGVVEVLASFNIGVLPLKMWHHLMALIQL